MKKIVLMLLLLANLLILSSCTSELPFDLPEIKLPDLGFDLPGIFGDDTDDNNNDNTSDNNNDNNNNSDNGNTNVPHEHSYSEKYSVDAKYHWLECSCGEKKDKEEHTLISNYSYEASVCSVCNTVCTEENYYSSITSLGVDPSQPHNAYQVLVYSFYDSDGDGYGDLAGLESKLDYIKDLGCDIIWLSPIMESESYHAYDITSFYRIDPKIGTIDDYLSLVNTAHEKGMKIMLDMPINHTSPNHEWFIEYLNGNSDYNEFYQEKDPSVKYGTGSSMGAKATFYTDKETGKTYFAAFGPTMPDLNYQSEALVNAIYEVFDYWTILGADGYRFDAVKHIFDPNEIPSGEDSVYLNNELFQELGAHLKEMNPNIYLLGENFSGQGEVIQYAESFDAEFDFDSWHSGLGAVTNKDPWNQGERRKYFDDTVVGCTNELIAKNSNWIPTFMTGNHDVTRAASYIGDKVDDDQEAFKLYAAMIALRSGIPFIYYGDEIGMYGENKSGDGKVEDSQIRLPMNFYDTTIDLRSVFYSVLDNGTMLGDNMLIDWSSYKTDNPVVEDAIENPNSLYNTYKDLIAFRNAHPAIYKGTMSQHNDYSGQGTIITFQYADEVLHVAFNFSESELVITDLCLDGDLELVYSVNSVDTDGYGLTLGARGVAVFTTEALDMGYSEETFDANYGLVITHADGTKTFVKLKPVDEFEGFSQHFGDNVSLQVGDVITLIDFYNGNAEWAEDNLSRYGQYAKFSTSSNGVTCKVAGIYDFYVKFKWEADEIYIGNQDGA